MLIDKYNKIILDKLPGAISKEVEGYYEDTEGFTDPDAIEITEAGFNELYSIIEKDYPEAIKPKRTLKVKGVKPKLTKKKPHKVKLKKHKVDKPKLKKTKETKKKLVKKAETEKGGKLNCNEAITELKEIEKKKEEAQKKRAEAPKKKVSTAFREQQLKAFSTFVRTPDFKKSKKDYTEAAKDLVAFFKTLGLRKPGAEQLQKDMEAHIEKQYKSEK